MPKWNFMCPKEKYKKNVFSMFFESKNEKYQQKKSDGNFNYFKSIKKCCKIILNVSHKNEIKIKIQTNLQQLTFT